MADMLYPYRNPYDYEPVLREAFLFGYNELIDKIQDGETIDFDKYIKSQRYETHILPMLRGMAGYEPNMMGTWTRLGHEVGPVYPLPLSHVEDAYMDGVRQRYMDIEYRDKQ